MNYYIDTEFIEDFHKPIFGKKRHYIDLISIGIVASDGREYYAISNEFDIKAVWNKFEWKEKPVGNPDPSERPWQKFKEYWLRENVLKSLYDHSATEALGEKFELKYSSLVVTPSFSLRAMKELIKKYGKSNAQIAREITEFVYPSKENSNGLDFTQWQSKYSNPVFYGYYGDYDWVLLCSLFGRMIDLPSGFPMYLIDLKQGLDEHEWELKLKFPEKMRVPVNNQSGCFIDHLKEHPNYPKQPNSHHALDDAHWNKKLHEFLNSI